MRWNEMKFWQKRKLCGWFSFFVVLSLLVTGYAVTRMNADKKENEKFWEAGFRDDKNALKLASEYNADATEVKTGTYVETMKEISLKNSNYRIIFVAWFRWKGNPDLNPAENSRIYNGYIHKKEMLKDYHHKSDNYQQVRMDVTVGKNFATARFPLESQVLRFYIESTLPVDEVMFTADRENSGVNQNLNITGYKLMNHQVGVHTMQYPTSENNPRFEKAQMHSEMLTSIEINRDSWGLYLKCFIALIGTLGWCFLTLFISANHQVNPLGTIPAALFGTVGNVMIGSNLLPDAIELGLVEYVNLFGTIIILGTAVSIININRIREHIQDKEYAAYFGRVMFAGLLIICIIGNIAMPVSAYLWGK